MFILKKGATLSHSEHITPYRVKTAEMDHLVILHRILCFYKPVSTETAQLIYAYCKEESFRKNEIVFQEKRYEAFEYFQIEGVSHRFNINESKQPVTTGIYQGETVITPHFARTSNDESRFSLQALTDCTFLKVSAVKFRELMDQNLQIQLFGRAVVENEYTRGLAFEVLFRSCTAKDRLVFFRENYPMLENVIPHTIIASFLGITPVSFSRLRSEFARK